MIHKKMRFHQKAKVDYIIMMYTAKNWDKSLKDFDNETSKRCYEDC